MQLYWYQANPTHARHIEYVDIKCFDLCADVEAWKQMAEQAHIRMCRGPTNEHIGFWVGYIDPAKTMDDYPKLQLLKLGVIPSARGKGISRALLRDVRTFAYSIGAHTQIQFDVPESLLTPRWSDCYIGGWVSKMNFKPAQPTLVDARHSLYGTDFAHFYRFVHTPHTPAIDA